MAIVLAWKLGHMCCTSQIFHVTFEQVIYLLFKQPSIKRG